MINVSWSIVLPAVLAFAMASFAPLQTQTPADQARAFFDEFVRLEQAYDVKVADLYADDAVIRNKRTYPTGDVREMRFPAAQYKALIRQGMPVAKQRGDRSAYSRCAYEPVGARVRISCSRYSELKKYTSPYTLVVGPGRSGWLIFEEHSESRP
ncbi:MAG: hypothetical protein ABIS06_09870 [Vicinamibacterales bacterium]